MNRSTATFFALTLVALLPCIADAHETFLLPLDASGGGVNVVLSSTESYPRLDLGPKIERIAKLSAAGPDPAASLVAIENGDKALRLKLNAHVPGAYALSLELLPRDLELTPDKVQEYFEEIDASPEIRKSYLELPEPRSWHETYTKYSRSFLCVTRCGDMRAFEQPGGMKVEFRLMPETDKQRLRRLVLLSDGSPVAGLPVAIFQYDGKKTFTRTLRDGTVSVPTSTTGTVLLSTVILEQISGHAGTYRSAFCTLTIAPQVLAAVVRRAGRKN